MKRRRDRVAASRGFSLVEAVTFIVVLGVLFAALVVAMGPALRSSPEAGRIDRAAELAQSRMELILGQRRAAGFAAFADPCPGPAICTPPPGYTVTSSISAGWGGDPANYKVVTVAVSGISSATATAVVANY